jgi:serine phosphatase RsbU (regulator of sigma subunit)
VDAGASRVAQYTHLPPGSYSFRVKACNDDGLWNETGASFPLTLLPHAWQTGWFHGLEGLAALGLVVGALVFQRRRLDAKRETALREADHRRKTEELDEARRVQLALLPKDSLTIGAWTVAGRMETATEVGGDYFGWIETGGRLGVVIADATGHGMTSGLVAGMLKAVVASLARSAGRNAAPAAWLESLNDALRSSIAQRGLGVCAGIAMADVETGVVEIATAGVPHPFHVKRSGGVERLPLSGTPLGYLKRLAVESASRTLAPGDRLVLVTDGLIEQTNAAGEEWGYEGVEAVLAALATRGSTPAEIAEGVLAACGTHGAGCARADDRTVVVLARCDGQPSRASRSSQRESSSPTFSSDASSIAARR